MLYGLWMMLVAFNAALIGGEFGIGWGLAAGFATIGVFRFLEYLFKRRAQGR